MTDPYVSRRRLLRGVAAGTAGTGIASTALAEGPDRHVVGLTADAGFDVARSRADSVHRELDFGRFGKAVAGRFPGAALEALRSNAAVEYVEADGQVYAVAQTLPWGVDRVDADQAHGNGITGNGADVAIVDTGIDDDHPDLQPNLGTGKAFVSCSGSTCNYAWSDDNGHGTHCAGIADAVDNSKGVVGVATESTLHAVKVLDGSGSGSFSDVAAGIEYVADQNWDVASLSLGASSGSQVLRDAVRYAWDLGVLVVAAAGNSGPCRNCVSYPAAYPEVVAVSATDPNDALAGFSSQGSAIEVAAPGKDVYSTDLGGTYQTLSGTSMSCPHVSGAGGILMSQGQNNFAARRRLGDTAENLGLPSNEQGKGLLDVPAAVRGCVDATHWPAGTGDSGAEYVASVDLDGQVTVSSGTDAYYDFTCPDVATVSQGGSFTVTVDFRDAGYNSHYCNLFVDWDKNRDWSTATQYKLFKNVNADGAYSATFSVPSSAALGSTLGRLRLSWNRFYGPSTTGQYGEVEDFTFEVV